jgi:hypothetical protein
MRFYSSYLAQYVRVKRKVCWNLMTIGQAMQRLVIQVLKARVGN